MHVEEALKGVPVDQRCQCPSLFGRIKAFFGFSN